VGGKQGRRSFTFPSPFGRKDFIDRTAALRWVQRFAQRNHPMSTDIHQGSLAAFRDIPAADDHFDQQSTRSETTIPVAALVITVVFVSFVAVVMATS
jgi:hypothetical protein